MSPTDRSVSRPGKCVGIIQARMGSTRFPGKVLKQLGDKTVLGWVVHRIRTVSRLDDVVIATTTNDEDDVIEQWCSDNHVKCFRGSPDDVLARYYDCALSEDAESIVRITADCPLIEASLVDSIILAGRSGNWDYFSMGGDFPDGLDCEWFTFDALETAFTDARRASEREHVTLFMRNNSGRIRTGSLAPFENIAHIRITVDEPADLVLLREILLLSKNRTEGPTIEETLWLLAREPRLGEINSHVPRNEGLRHSLARESDSP